MERVLEAWRDGDRAETLRQMVAAWAEVPHPELAFAIDHLDAVLAFELGGWSGSPKAIRERFDDWDDLDAVQRIGATTAMFSLTKPRFAEVCTIVSETRDPRLWSQLSMVVFSAYHRWGIFESPIHWVWEALRDPRGTTVLPRRQGDDHLERMLPAGPSPDVDLSTLQPMFDEIRELTLESYRFTRKLARARVAQDEATLLVEMDDHLDRQTLWGELAQLEAEKRAGGKVSKRQIKELHQRLQHALIPKLAKVATKIEWEWGLPRSCTLRALPDFGLPLASNEPAILSLETVIWDSTEPPGAGWIPGPGRHEWVRRPSR